MTTITRQANVIVVEDNLTLRQELRFQLGHAGFNVRTASDATELAELLQDSPSDILVLDVNLPGENGFSIAQRLCDRSQRGIIMLTARGDIEDKLRGFEEGADLYLIKPVDRRELVASIRSLYYRLTPASARVSSGWKLNRIHRTLHGPDGRTLELTAQELCALDFLLEEPGITRSRSDLVGRLGFDFMHFPEGRTNTVISRLRQKLTGFSNKLRILTFRSQGYSYVGPDIAIIED